MLEKELSVVKAEAEQFTIEMKPYEIKTFKISNSI